jgi:hypothetical protein
MKNGQLNNDNYFSLLAEVEAEMPPALPESVIQAVRNDALRDWRSLPTEHPFYQEGASLENTIAAELSFLYGAVTTNEKPDRYEELMTEQPTKIMNF